MRSLWKNSLWIIFIIIMALLVPSSISLHAQTEDRSIVVAMGVDKLAEEKYEVSAEIIVPRYETTYNQNAQVISSIGINSTEAINGLSIHIGKILGLSHCSTILIGESLKDDNIIEIIDQVLRSKRVNYNAQLIFCEGSSKAILKKAVEIDKNFNRNLNDIAQFNNQYLKSKSMLLSNFYKVYYENHGACFVPVMSLVTQEYNGISALQTGESSSGGGGEGGDSSGGDSQSGGRETSEGGGQSSDSSSSSGGDSQDSKKQQYLSNDGKTAIFNEGKLVKILDAEQVAGFGVLTNNGTKGLFTVDNVTDDVLTNASLSLSIRAALTTKTIGFSKNNKPRVYYTINYKLRVEEIKNELSSSSVTNDNIDFLSPQAKAKIVEKIKLDISSAVNLTKELKLDLFDTYTTFERFAPKKWYKYLDTLDNKWDYMQDVEFFVDVIISNID